MKGKLITRWAIKDAPWRISRTNQLMARILKSEAFLISIVLQLLIFLFFTPTLLEGKLPLNTGYLYGIYPWAAYRADLPGSVVVNSVLSDEYDAQIPTRQFFLNQIRDGEFPLWNPLVNSGMPIGLIFFTNSFSLMSFTTIVLGAKWGSLFYMFLKLYIAGIFMYGLLRYRRLGVFPSLFGSVVLMFSAHILVNSLKNVADSGVYAPAVLYFAERFLRQRRWLYFSGLTAFISITLISGFPSVTLYTLLLISIYITYRVIVELRDKPTKQRLKDLIIVYSAFLIALLLVSFTLLPTYEFFQNVNLGYRVGRGSTIFNWEHFGRLLNPNICGNPTRGNWICSANYNETALFVGLLPLAVVPFSLSNKKYKLTSWFFFIAASLILMIVFGVASLNSIVGNLPLFNINPNTRMIALLPVCFSFISSIGVENLEKKNWKSYLLTLSIPVLLLLTWYFFNNAPFSLKNGGVFLEYFQRQELYTYLLIITNFFLIIIILSMKNGAARQLLLGTLLIVTFGERVLFMEGYNGKSYPETFYPKTPTIDFLSKEMRNDERMIVLSRHFPPSMPLYYSINSLVGHTFASKEYKQNLELINPGLYKNNTTQPRFTSSSINLLSPLLDLYRVRYVVAPPTDDYIWFESLTEQKEYNTSYSMSNLTSFGQTIVSKRDGFPEILEIQMRVPDNIDIPARVKIKSGDKVLLDYIGKFVSKHGGWYEFSFPRIPVGSGQELALEVILPQSQVPNDARFLGTNVEIYRDGKLFINQEGIDGDLTFALLEYNPLIEEQYKIVHKKDMTIYENTNIRSGLPVVTNLIYSDEETCAEQLRRIDPFTEAIVEEDNLRLTNVDSPSSAVISEYRNNEVVIQANIRQDSMVVLSDSYYTGWRVFIDGKEVDTHRVNCTMRGVIVKPGEHVILFKYMPRSFQVGAIISLLTLTGLFLIPIFSTRKRARNKSSNKYLLK